jgi:hypothetical protein
MDDGVQAELYFPNLIASISVNYPIFMHLQARVKSRDSDQSHYLPPIALQIP